MFKRDIGNGMAFTTSCGIHTFFVLVPIDIVLLNKNDTVEKLYKNVHPWRVIWWGFTTYTVVELPMGTIAKQKLTAEAKFADSGISLEQV